MKSNALVTAGRLAASTARDTVLTALETNDATLLAPVIFASASVNAPPTAPEKE